jgi:ABC-type multidrug transport system ATPase subunit
VLDEPFNGLDPVMRVTIQRLVSSMNEQLGMTILYATHVLSEVGAVARRVVILKQGRVVCDSPLSELPGGVEQTFMRCYGLQTAAAD